MTESNDLLAVARSRVGDLAARGVDPAPRRKLAVLTCMDARIDVFRMLGLERGDAHVIRNAGGLVTDDAIRSIAASQRLLGTEEVVVIMHEGCGLHGGSDEEFAQQLARDGVEPGWRLGAFEDLQAALNEGLNRLRNSPELAVRDRIRGWIFDPETGTLRDVEAPGSEAA